MHFRPVRHNLPRFGLVKSKVEAIMVDNLYSIRESGRSSFCFDHDSLRLVPLDRKPF